MPPLSQRTKAKGAGHLETAEPVQAQNEDCWHFNGIKPLTEQELGADLVKFFDLRPHHCRPVLPQVTHHWSCDWEYEIFATLHSLTLGMFKCRMISEESPHDLVLAQSYGHMVVAYISAYVVATEKNDRLHEVMGQVTRNFEEDQRNRRFVASQAVRHQRKDTERYDPRNPLNNLLSEIFMERAMNDGDISDPELAMARYRILGCAPPPNAPPFSATQLLGIEDIGDMNDERLTALIRNAFCHGRFSVDCRCREIKYWDKNTKPYRSTFNAFSEFLQCAQRWQFEFSQCLNNLDLDIKRALYSDGKIPN